MKQSSLHCRCTGSTWHVHIRRHHVHCPRTYHNGPEIHTSRACYSLFFFPSGIHVDSIRLLSMWTRSPGIRPGSPSPCCRGRAALLTYSKSLRCVLGHRITHIARQIIFSISYQRRAGS